YLAVSTSTLVSHNIILSSSQYLLLSVSFRRYDLGGSLRRPFFSQHDSHSEDQQIKRCTHHHNTIQASDAGKTWEEPRTVNAGQSIDFNLDTQYPVFGYFNFSLNEHLSLTKDAKGR